MTASAQTPVSAYDTLTAVTPRLLSRDADPRAVSLLGQAVSDVLDRDGTDTVIRRMVADLESAHADALADEINAQWALPLATVLGLLRQHLHNRRVAANSANPTSITLRDRIVAALEAGVDTPTTISRHINSPVTVVSRILRRLAAEGTVTRQGSDSDKRIRRYRLVNADEQVSDAAGRERETGRGISDPRVLVTFARTQLRLNAKPAAVLLPDLVAAGSDTRQPPDVRVAALAVASTMVRSVGGPTAADDAMDLSESADLIARQTEDDALLARAAYERARAILFAFPQQVDLFAEEIDRAEAHARRLDDIEAFERLGWCNYSRCILHDRTQPDLAMKYAQHALEYFDKADSNYGRAAARVAMTRVGYVIDLDGAKSTAFEAFSLANRGGFLRLMAESAFWAGEVVSDTEPERAQRLFRTATQHFEAVGNHSWRALASLSLSLSKAEYSGDAIDEDDARRIVEELLGVQRAFETHLSDDPAASMSWATAVFRRRLGSWLRLAGDFSAATHELTEAVRIYRATANTQGEALALAGLVAAKRGHPRVEEDDALTAQQNVTSGRPDTGSATDVVAQLLDKPGGELLVAI
jgi:DNA-binding MarR family transcriptional regulator